MNERDLKKLSKILQEIERKYKSIGKVSPFQGKEAAEVAKHYGSIEDAMKSMEITMKGVRAEILEMDSGLEGIKDTVRDIGRELGGINSPIKNMTKGFRTIRNLANDLSDIQFDLTQSTIKQTKSLKHKVNLEYRRLASNVKSLKVQIESGDLQGVELARAKELLSYAEDSQQALVDKVGHQDEFNNALNDTIKRQKNIKSAMGLTGGILKGLTGFAEKIGFGDMSDDLKVATDLMGEQATQLTDNGNRAATLGDKFKVMGTGIASMGKSLLAALTDPFVIITMLIKAVKFLVSIFQNVLKQTVQIGQSLGTAGTEARNLRNQMNAIGDANRDIFYFTEEIMAAYGSLNQAAGMSLRLNAENVKHFQDLTLYMGLSEKSAQKLFLLSAKSGKPYNEMYNTIAETTQSLNEQTGITQSTGNIIEQIAGASGQMKYNVKGGTEGLVKAAHTAARLGLSMEEIAAAAESHLDFESSIQKEIEAEMFLQKDLNLDKLRYAALTGDIATQAAEEERLIRENASSLKGNVLAQQAFAAATGISMENLGKALNHQDELTGLAGEESKDKLSSAEQMIADGKEAVRIERTWASMVKQIRAALEPLALKLMPIVMKLMSALPGVLDKIISFVGSPAGKVLLGLAGIAVGIKMAQNMWGKLKELFLGKVGESPINPMYVYQVNAGGGGVGGNLLKSVFKGNMFKYLGNKGGLSRTMNRGFIKAFGKTKFTKFFQTKVFNPLGKSSTSLGRGMNNLFAKIIPNSATNLTKAFGTNNMAKIMKIAKTGVGVDGKLVTKATQSKAITKVAYATKGRLGGITTQAGQLATKVAPKTTAVVTKAVAPIVKAVAPIAKGTTSLLTGIAKKAGPIGAVLDLAIGGYTGSQQADMSAEEQKAAGVKEGIGKVEATTLGVLTGGAEKGSMFSETLGMEKGGAGDEALGIAMAAGRGALVGGAIGSVIPVVGTAVGAAIGGVVGTVSEGFKVFSDPNSSLRKGISEFASSAGEKISGWASSAGSAISGWASDVGDFAKNAGGKIADFAKKGVKGFVDFNKKAGAKIAGWAKDAGSAISGWASKAGSKISGWASKAGSAISGWASSAGSTISGWASSAGEKISGWASNVGSAVSSFATSSWDTLSGWASTAGSTISGWASSAGETLSGWASSAGEMFSNVTSSISGALSSLASGAKNIASKAWEGVKGVGSSIKDKASSVYESVKKSKYNPVNWFAEGGVVTSPVNGIVGEAGPEAIIPLSQAGNMLGSPEVVALLKQILVAVNKGGDVYLDGSKVGHALALQSSQMG